MDQIFTAAPHHDVLVLLVQIAVLLFTARVLGEISQRLGQPTVVGEILAGIVLGPSLLSGLIPALSEWIVPHNEVQGYLLELVSLIGVMFLLLITGLETDLALIRQQARSALGIALGGLLLPLALGYLLGQMLPDHMLVDPDQRLVFALFIAIAMAIAAIPVVAKVLMDLNLTRRDIGQSIIAAAMIDDTTGWVLLSVVIGLASGSAITVASVGQSVVTVLAFMFLSLTAGRWLINRLLAYVQNTIQMRDKVLSLVVLMMFVWGAIGHALGIEALLGAFIVGIVFSQIPQLNPDVIHKLESITLGIFAPIFFAVAGLKVDISRLLEPRLLVITGIVIAVAIICKMVGVYIGARLIGASDHWTAIFFGAGLNARGSIGIIVANIGLSWGILTQDMFSIIVVMAVVTSLMSPSVMKWAIRHITPQQQEIDRLRREELNQTSLIANVRRVLLPVRLRDKGGESQLIEAMVLEKLQANTDLSLTLMTIVSSEQQSAARAFLDELGSMFSTASITKKVVIRNNIREQILDEARKSYDLMILGAAEKQSNSKTLFTPLVDDLVRLAPCPTMLVQGARLQDAQWAPDHILVPSNGSLASRRAAEVAFALTGGTEEVRLLQVVEQHISSHSVDATGSLLERQKMIAHISIAALYQLGLMQGVKAIWDVEVGMSPEAVILDYASRKQIDLIILGTNVGVGSDHLYLGPRVERILSRAACPVIVINA